MTQQACPDAFHQGDGITQLTQTAAFLQGRDKQYDPNNYVLFNQHLAGFFTSVDKDRFLSAYRIMARWYRDKNHQHADTFYIDHCQQAPTHRVHRGKSRLKQQDASSGSKLSIHLKDIPQLISAVLLLNYFAVGQTLIEQFRGAPHGLTMQSSIMQPRCCGGGAMLAPHVRWSFLQPQVSSTFTTPARHIFCH